MTPADRSCSLEQLTFDNRFTRDLPADPLATNARRQVRLSCYSRVAPTPVVGPRLVAHSREVADLLGIPAEMATSEEFAQVFAGNRVLKGMDPFAMCYGGHQFGNWAGQLGDGRAINLGELVTPNDQRWTLQLKGAGPTPYSRTADGLAVLRSSVREFLCSEAMHHLGVPTTRALSLCLTGEKVMRDMFYNGNPQAEPGAVVCRVAQSFLRFGNFEILNSRNDLETNRRLVEFTIRNDFPHLGEATSETIARWFHEVCERTATMIIHWMRVGFVHGVMNTDNMSILGLTLDYGPYGFLDAYDPQFICNHTDSQGRYSFINQPVIAHWNLRALALALSDLIPTETLIEKLATFENHFGGTYHALMRAKLGLTHEVEGDNKLIGGLLGLMNKTRADYTLSFRNLTGEDADWLKLFGEANTEAKSWLSRYRVRTQSENLSGLNRINPKYVLRNWVAETAIRDVEDKNDVATLGRIFKLMQSPFATHDGDDAFAAPPPPNMCDLEVSCSS